MSEKFVLLVEDNEDDVHLTQIAFKKCGISNELKVVWDGQEALDFLFGRGEPVGRDIDRLPAVVLLDLKLPCVSGQDVLRQIRLDNQICRLPVVVLSSTVDVEEIEECERL